MKEVVEDTPPSVTAEQPETMNEFLSQLKQRVDSAHEDTVYHRLREGICTFGLDAKSHKSADGTADSSWWVRLEPGDSTFHIKLTSSATPFTVKLSEVTVVSDMKPYGVLYRFTSPAERWAYLSVQWRPCFEHPFAVSLGEQRVGTRDGCGQGIR